MTQESQSDWSCDHRDMRPVQRVLSDGRQQLGLQCVSCGQWQAKKSNSFAEGTQFGQYDAAIRDAFANNAFDRYAASRKQQQQEQKNRWWAIYQEFIRSPTWRNNMRTAVLERDGRICQSCLRMPAEHVHHVKYPKTVESVTDFENQPLFEMQSVCKKCHAKIHPNRELL